MQVWGFPVIGPDNDKIPYISRYVKKETVWKSWVLVLTSLRYPDTLDHIAFYTDQTPAPLYFVVTHYSLRDVAEYFGRNWRLKCTNP